MLIGLTASGAILAGFEAIVSSLLASDLPIVGSFVGLFAPALLGPRAGVILNSLTFLFSAAVIASIRVAARPKNAAGEFRLSLLGADVVESFRFLRDHQELRGLLIVVALAILGGGAIIPVSQTYVPLHLFGAIPLVENIEWLSQLLAAPSVFMLVFMALGMVVGALLVPRLEHRMRLQLLFAGSVATFGAALLGFASVDRYWVAALFTALAGASIAGVSVSGNSYVVRTTDDDIRGRVFTALESVVRVALLLSMIVMAPLSDLLAGAIQGFVESSGLGPGVLNLSGPRLTLQISALIVLGAAAYAFRVLEWRTCEVAAERHEDAAAPPTSAEGASGV
jgi:dTMP kinase